MSDIVSRECNTPDMTTFLASSVHDMKNSVSLLISGLEKTLAATTPETLATYDELSHMAYEAKRINHNLVQLLTLYKFDQQLYPFDAQYIALADFLPAVAEQVSGFLQSQGIEFELNAPPDLYWPFDEDLITGVIGNALSNALRYARGRIRLSADTVGDFLEIRIEDDGKGFAPEIIDQALAVQRGISFETGSTGLGLYFSAKVAAFHRNQGRCGEIKLENGGSFGGGCFVVRLP